MNFIRGPSTPCPLWFNHNSLPDIGPAPEGMFNPECLWWSHEKLHRSVLLDYQARIQIFAEERDALEKSWIRDALIVSSNRSWEMTQEAFRQADQKTLEWTEQVQSIPVKQTNKWTYGRYWKNENRKAGITVC